MNTININPTDLSLIFWRKILDNSFLKKSTIQKYISLFFSKSERKIKINEPTAINIKCLIKK